MAMDQPSTTSEGSNSIRELLATGDRSFSFEFFPPKTEKGEQTLWRSIRELEMLNPTFVSVTYGAGGATRDRTVDITGRISTDTTLTAMGHLTAVNHSVEELRHVIGRYADAGVSNILALRGDPPGDPQAEWTPHPEGFTHAEQLVDLVVGAGKFSVGVAAFPEKHPRSPDFDTDVRYLVGKFRAGADFGITQLFFHVEDYLRLRDKVEAAGQTKPIIPGIMPVTNLKQIEKFTQLCGADFPADLAARFRAVEDDPVAVDQLGIEVATEMCERLLAEGAPGLHFYTLNKSAATREIYSALRLPVPA